MDIVEFAPEHLEHLLDIWLKASVQAHDFIPSSFWEGMLPAMRDTYLPAARTWVALDNGNPQGFVSLVEDNLAALFVRPDQQGKGIGRLLMSHAKAQGKRLQLTVYKENVSAYGFYLAQGFSVLNEQCDPHTGHPELVMEWVSE